MLDRFFHLPTEDGLSRCGLCGRRIDDILASFCCCCLRPPAQMTTLRPVLGRWLERREGGRVYG
jgi:hypothetical protein